MLPSMQSVLDERDKVFMRHLSYVSDNICQCAVPSFRQVLPHIPVSRSSPRD